MNVSRVVLAAFGAFVAYFVVGGATFVLFPSLKTEFLKYPAVYRDHDGQMSHMPAGMAAIFLSIAVLAVLYAMQYQAALSIGEGARSGLIFGALIGLFVIGGFVLHNYANLNIGLRLTLQQAVAYFAEWLIVGIVIGLIYRPATH
jgi:uncharacterized membrane protein